MVESAAGGAGVLARIAQVALLAVATAGSDVAAAGDWLVVDLIGHQLVMVRSVPLTTGSNVDRNEQQALAVGDDLLSNAVVRETSGAIRQADPEARVHELALSASERSALLASGDGKADVDAVRLAALVAGKLPDATRIVVVSPYRAEFRLRISHGAAASNIGHGKAAGLGFYIDRSTPLAIAGTSEQGRGFLGIFAHARVAVLDANGARLVDDSFAAGTTVASAKAEDANPWNVLGNDEKIGRLAAVYRQEIGRVLPPLVRAVVAVPKVNREKT